MTDAKTWGYWGTLGWAVLAFFAGQFVGFGVILWLRAGAWNSIVETPYDGVLVTLFIVISNPVTIGVLALAARLTKANPAEYFALYWPQRHYVTVGIAGLVALIAVFDASLFFSGHAVVTSFQLQSYTTAATEGWLLPMALAAIVVAPAGEEIMFRGFLFRGWARSDRTAWPAIVVISLVWAGLHIQYDWTGVLQIFVIGLFLGWLRWRSGSMLLTFLLHALFNLEGTFETLVQVHWLAK
jgi:membrane protease YdiL (CAAX protease family)